MPISKYDINKNTGEPTSLFSREKPRVLIVDDSEISVSFLSELLKEQYTIDTANNVKDALTLCLSFAPDLVLVDYQLNDASGVEVCRQIKQSHYTENTSVIMISGENDLESERLCWEAGCVDYINKPFIKESLLHRVAAHTKLKQMTDKLRQLSMIDNVTNVFNRHYLEQYMYQNSVRSETNAVSLFFIDIDYFKRYNDHYGHLAGDICLKEVAKAIEKNLKRPSDFVARYGGEEFAIILPSTVYEGATMLADNIINSVWEADLPHAASPLGKITVSVGGVTYDEPLLNWKEMLLKADELLYKAKESGRNQIQFEHVKA